MSAPLLRFGLFGENTSLLIALCLGIAFGFFLERGGLGSARKLTAQFYHTDLSVFKIMFSAIITAMTGLFWLSWIGFLDLSQVHVLPTYLIPQTIGGLIFGVGFVMGGYCPGTSCVAAATGKFDGFIHLIGMMTGILLFGELFPQLEGFYNSTALGQITIPELIGLPSNLMVLAFTLLAVAGFVFAGRIEKRTAASEPSR
jgi:uncharacterized protein